MTAERRAVAVAALLAAACVLRPTTSDAHAVGISRGEYRVAGTQVQADLVFARRELATAVTGLDTDRDGEIASAELDHERGALVTHERSALAAWIERGVEVHAAGRPCIGRVETASLTEQDGLAISAVYDCPPISGSVTVRMPLLADLSLGHRHLAAIVTTSETTRAVLYQAQPAVSVDTAPTSTGSNVAGAAAIVPPLFALGVEHILTGWDHLLFLLALVLVATSLRSVLTMVTAFTVAHSVTLAVAALGVWTPRPSLVEPAIALSIAYVGVENLVARDLRKRWRLTFLFGLVHGFGFAGALREVAVSATQLPLALASFNLGVETGQLAMLAAVLPIVWWLGRRPWFAHGGLQAGSVAVSLAGVWWFVERVTGG